MSDDKAALEEAFSKLSAKERLFVESYYTCKYNASKAIVMAGYDTKYPSKMGYQLTRKPHIKAAIDLLMQQKIKEVTVSAEYVVRKLVRIVEKAEIENNYTAVLRGLELLGRHLSMFVDRTEISGRDGDAIKLEKVQNDADAFTRAIAGLATRGRETGVAGETEH